jgi:hypothetical protein
VSAHGIPAGLQITYLLSGTEEFVAAGDFLTYQFPTFQWFVRSIGPVIENAEADFT